MKPTLNHTTQLEAQAKLLRARIDSEVTKPAVILVTSAQCDDGASLTATTIAGAFAETGVRTVLFNATSNVTRGRQNHSHVNVSKPEVLHSREELVDFVGSLRSSYEITIVEAPPVLESDAVNALIGIADATLISFRLGRVAGDGDILISRILERSEDCLLGVVMTDPDAIADFDAVPPSPNWPLPPGGDVQNAPAINQSLVHQISTGILTLAFIMLALSVKA